MFWDLLMQGVAVKDEVISRFNEMKIRHQEAALVLEIVDGAVQITGEVTKAELEGLSFEEYHKKILEKLPRDKCVFILWDFVYSHNDMTQSKLCLVRW
jgi:F0F1-type ATP synthase alpha subunit